MDQAIFDAITKQVTLIAGLKAKMAQDEKDAAATLRRVETRKTAIAAAEAELAKLAGPLASNLAKKTA